MSGPGAALLALLTLAYPFGVFVAIRRDQTAVLWVMAAVGVVLVIVRARPQARASTPTTLMSVATPAMLAVLALVGHFAQVPRLALVWPVLVNLAFLWTFAGSLASTPIVERLARLQDPDLTPAKIAYCRTVTKVWCGFFVLNGAIIALLALASDLRWWTLYAGVISYLLMGLLFVVELIVRQAKFGWQAAIPQHLGQRLISLWRRAFAR